MKNTEWMAAFLRPDWDGSSGWTLVKLGNLSQLTGRLCVITGPLIGNE